MSGRRGSLMVVAAMLASATYTSVSPTPVAADEPEPTSMGLITMSMDPQPLGRMSTLTVEVDPAGTGGTGGTVTFLRLDGTTEIELGTVPVLPDPFVFGLAIARLDFPSDLGEGTYPVIARYSGTATYAPSESEIAMQTVGPRPTQTMLRLGTSDDTPPSALKPGISLYIWWDVWDRGDNIANPLPESGALALTLDGVEIENATMHGQTVLDVSTLALGPHTIEAAYGGNTDFAPSSTTAAIIVVSNTVDATGVTLDQTTFYPRKDGYRDVVKSKGDRLEPLSVSVKVYDSKGRRVRTLSVAAGTGPYSISWNGRNTAGVLKAPGRYKVVQTLKDGAGKTLAVTRYVKLSHKKLVSKTAYVSKLGKDRSVVDHTGNAKMTRSSAGWAKLSAGSPGTAIAGWQFTLPKAIRYSKVTLQVDAKARVISGPNGFGIQDFSLCPYDATADWFVGCFSPYTEIGKGHRAWQSLGGSATLNRSGRHVRGVVAINVGTAYIYKMRVKVTYKVLR